MISQEEFKTKYESEIHMYYNWGIVVKEFIVNKISLTDNCDDFIKINFLPRVKKIDSLIEKAYFREDKNYTDPYNDITDKVGIRFVVMTLDDIRKICSIVEGSDIWNCSKDKDFDEQRETDPFKFGYESVHYVVRNKNEIVINDAIKIKAGTPCEIQIRTLLQHAYSELTHDTIYKPKTKVVSSVKRIAARSMALIETTDELFKEVNEVIIKEEQAYINLLPELCRIYSEIEKLELEKKINIYILDSYKEIIKDIDASKIKEFIEENSFLKERIHFNYKRSMIYRQPIILLLYYLVDKKQYMTKKHWPLPQKELESIFTDLGKSIS